MAAIRPKRKVRGVLPAQRCFIWVGMFLRLHNTLLCHINRSICCLVCCFLCSQLFALSFTNSLQLVNHHFTPLIFVGAQPSTTRTC